MTFFTCFPWFPIYKTHRQTGCAGTGGTDSTLLDTMPTVLSKQSKDTMPTVLSKQSKRIVHCYCKSDACKKDARLGYNAVTVHPPTQNADLWADMWVAALGQNDKDKAKARLLKGTMKVSHIRHAPLGAYVDGKASYSYQPVRAHTRELDELVKMHEAAASRKQRADARGYEPRQRDEVTRSEIYPCTAGGSCLWDLRKTPTIRLPTDEPRK